MKIQITLNDHDAAQWKKIASRPEFVGTTRVGIIARLMHSYLKDSPTITTYQTPSTLKVPEPFTNFDE